jgi:hypothetical protein
MNNKITASVTFNFKGETLIPRSELNLDKLMQRYKGLPPLHELLAAENNIDSHSYQYEILLAENIQFNDAQGDAITFFNNGEFDQAAFEEFWLQKRIFNKLQQIIQAELELDDIEQHPKLKQAMLAAFQYGQDNAKEKN